MAESIVKIIAASLTFLAAVFGDAILKKWITWFLVAYESSISEASRKMISESVAEFKSKASTRYTEWEAWRQSQLNKGEPPSK